MQAARLVGGAGTGKTTEILRLMEGSRTRYGGNPLAIGFSSLTRAARATAVSRASQAWGVEPEYLEKLGWFRTCHSVAYRQLGVRRAEIIGSDSKESAKWVAAALKVAVTAVLDDDTGRTRYAGEGYAGTALDLWDLARSRLEPLKEVIVRAARFGDDVPPFAVCKQYIERYESAKRVDGRVDYADLLTRYAGIHSTVDGHEEVEPEGALPAGVKVWYLDEMQDASALVDRLCRRLASGPEVEHVYLAGDPMQAIFAFGGSDWRYFMRWPVQKERVMEKTWRCPSPILSLGERCLTRMRKGYWDRGIAPADHEGSVERGGYRDAVVARLDPLASTLVLARCKHTLEAWETALQKRRVPYLMLCEQAATVRHRACESLWALENGKAVSAEDFACAVKWLPYPGNMIRGTKALWEKRETIEQWDAIRPEDLPHVGFKAEFAAKLLAGGWGEMFHKASKWRDTAKQYGPEIASNPPIRLSTIHAAKGMEADTVVLSTSLTRRVHASQAVDSEIHDEERRVEYVGVTRARRRLVIATDHEAEYRMSLPL